MRRQEARTALSILGVESGAIHFLDAADGTLNHLLAAQECELVARITQLLAAILKLAKKAHAPILIGAVTLEKELAHRAPAVGVPSVATTAK